MKRTVLLCMMMFCVLYAQVPQKTVRTVVSDLSVQASDTALILTWNLDPDAIPHIQELRIFRSHKRISSIAAAISAASHPQASSAGSNAAKAEGSDEGLFLIKTVRPETSEYTDTSAEPNKTYYYAVAAVEKNGSVYGLISPGLNASVSGVSLKKSQTAAEQMQRAERTKQKSEETAQLSPVPAETPEIMRERPLASLRIFAAPPAAAQQAGKHKTGKTADKVGRKTGNVTPSTDKSYTAYSDKEPDILSPDTHDKGMSGDDYSLFAIVDSLVKTKKWPEAQAELKRFLQVNRSEETTARAYFYLGQSLYFNENHRQALSCFQKSQVLYPVPSKRWIIETIDAYRIE